ncbi:hypothetical protein D3876_11235 [Sphingomonas cavernae]|uniref:DUF1579 domain-containing protein n=2 Tax=Sphingomonas cavernae TaxID=2320861 RepID=A0A418WL57_9SPHN|nr:hypothetical protein D3876_11235 [Sphingomonas cavernae]
MALILTLAPGPAYADAASGQAAFDRLKALVGNWKGQASNGRGPDVTFRLIAAGSVLVEDWTTASGRQSMTVFHMDGDALIATHYCPLGNQPRMALTPISEPTRFAFDFRDATNLRDPADAHQHGVVIEFGHPDSMTWTETYVAKGVPETTRIDFVRADKDR